MQHLVILTTAFAAAAVGIPSAAHAAPPTCQGIPVTIEGTTGDDTILGTMGRDVILGAAGDDLIRGLGGNDLICGGRDDDDLFGGPGDDELRGGNQSDSGDKLLGGGGNDHLIPGLDRNRPHQARDTMSWNGADAGVSVSVPRGTAVSTAGSAERDTLRVEDSLVFILTDHDDEIVSTQERDFVYPGGGNDRIFTVGGSDRVFFPANEAASDGIDVVRLGGDKDRVSHWVGAVRAWGGPGRDRLFTWGSGPNRLDGGGGPDWIRTVVAQVPAQRYRGGPGSDLFTLKGFAGDVTWDMVSGEALLGEEVQAEISAVESAHFAEAGGRLSVTGTAGDDYIHSRKAASFSALGGSDRFVGSREDDFFHGGPGRDEYHDDPGPGDVNTCVSVERDPRDSCS